MFDTHAHVVSDDLGRFPQVSVQQRHGTSAEALLLDMDRHGVARACIVQRFYVYGYDNSYVLHVAEHHPERFTAVVSIDAEQPGAGEALRALHGTRRVGGIRLAAPGFDRSDMGWLDSAPALAVWETATRLGLPVCVHILRRHRVPALRALRGLLRHFPETVVIVDHAGAAHAAPIEVTNARAAGFSDDDLERFAGGVAPDDGIDGDLLALRDYKRLYLKLSAINFNRIAEVRASTERFVARLVEQFGAERLVWGSDVGQSLGAYGDLVTTARGAVTDVPPLSRRMILSSNAETLYSGAA